MRSAAAVMLGLLALTSPSWTSPPSTQTRRPAPQTRTETQPRPAPARAETPVPFRAGERLTYDVAWSTYLIAGSATTTVVEKKPSYNSSAYYIVAEGRPIPLIQRLYPLYYKMDTLFDSFSTLSQRSALYTEEGNDRKTATTLFDRVKRRAFFEVVSDTNFKQDYAVPVDVQDGLSLLYALRTKTFKAGERLTTPVMDNGTLYNVSIDVGGPEHVRMRVGEFDAWNLGITIVGPDQKPVGKNVAVRISTDARRLPLRLQADLPVGYFALALRQAEQPSAQR